MILIVAGTDSAYLGLVMGYVDPGRILNVMFELKNNLALGIFYLNYGLREPHSDEAIFIHRRVDDLVFRVVADTNATVVLGVVDLAATLTVN